MSLRQAAQYFQTTYALPFPVEEIMEGINRTVEAFYFHDALPKPGVTALLEQLRQAGVAMGIATATDRYQIEAALRRCGLEHYFDAIFTCSEVGHGKRAAGDLPHGSGTPGRRPRQLRRLRGRAPRGPKPPRPTGSRWRRFTTPASRARTS